MQPPKTPATPSSFCSYFELDLESVDEGCGGDGSQRVLSLLARRCVVQQQYVV